MRRPLLQGGGASADSVSTTLGLLHHDGTPITLASCHQWSNALEEANRKLSAEFENMLCNWDGNIEEGRVLIEMQTDLQLGEACVKAWLALAGVFEVGKL